MTRRFLTWLGGGAGATADGTGFNDWHLTVGARLSPTLLTLLVVAAVAALALSAFGVLRDRRPGAVRVIVLRAAALAACLLAALQPTMDLRQIVRLPNRVAVLVDASRSMDVRPPNGGPSRAQRAATLLHDATALREAWTRDGHRLDLYTFGEGLAVTQSSMERGWKWKTSSSTYLASSGVGLSRSTHRNRLVSLSRVGIKNISMFLLCSRP